MRYEDPPYEDDATSMAVIVGGTRREAAGAMIGAALYSSDQRWAEATALALSRNPGCDLAYAGLLSLGHLGRRFRSRAFPEASDAAIRRGLDAEALRGMVQDVVEDFVIFVPGYLRPAGSRPPVVPLDALDQFVGWIEQAIGPLAGCFRADGRTVVAYGDEDALPLVRQATAGWGVSVLIEVDEAAVAQDATVGMPADLLAMVEGSPFFEFVLVDPWRRVWISDSRHNVLVAPAGVIEGRGEFAAAQAGGPSGVGRR